VAGDLDDYTSVALTAALDRVIAERPGPLRVDLGEVTHFSCSAVQVLLDARFRHLGPFRIERPATGVRKVLRVLGLDLDLNAAAG
jgi:anti-anti-sigma factor